MHHHQRVLVVASFLAAFGGGSSSSSVLAAAVPAPGGGGGGWEEQQKPLGRLLSVSGGVTRQYMSCEETYGGLWTTCGDVVCFVCLPLVENWPLLKPWAIEQQVLL
jgi:hypothetical protein